MKKSALLFVLIFSLFFRANAQNGLVAWNGSNGLWNVVEGTLNTQQLFNWVASTNLAAISFATNSPGLAKVYVNNQLIGSADYTKGLSCTVNPGTVTYKVYAYNGQVFEKTIYLQKGQTQAITLPVCWICGTWQDDNSYLVFRENGELFVKWNTGQSATGTWSINGNELLMNHGTWQTHNKIARVTADMFQYQVNSSSLFYTARRIKQ